MSQDVLYGAVVVDVSCFGVLGTVELPGTMVIDETALALHAKSLTEPSVLKARAWKRWPCDAVRAPVRGAEEKTSDW